LQLFVLGATFYWDTVYIAEYSVECALRDGGVV